MQTPTSNRAFINILYNTRFGRSRLLKKNWKCWKHAYEEFTAYGYGIWISMHPTHSCNLHAQVASTSIGILTRFCNQQLAAGVCCICWSLGKYFCRTIHIVDELLMRARKAVCCVLPRLRANSQTHPYGMAAMSEILDELIPIRVRVISPRCQHPSVDLVMRNCNPWKLPNLACPILPIWLQSVNPVKVSNACMENGSIAYLKDIPIHALPFEKICTDGHKKNFLINLYAACGVIFFCIIYSRVR